MGKKNYQILFLFFVLFTHTLYAHTEHTSLETTLTKQEKEYLKNNTITIGIENWEPIIYSEENNEIDGISADFLKRIIKDFDIKVKYIVKPWHELLEDFKNNKIDLLPATCYTKKRTEYGIYTSTYFKIKEFLFVNQNNTAIDNFQDLRDKKIAIIKGYGTIDKIQKAFPFIKIVETKSISHSISLLLENKVDAVYEAQFAMNNFLNNNLITGIKAIHQEQFKSSGIRMFINQKKQIIQAIFQKGLHNINQTEKNAIVQKWLQIQGVVSNSIHLTQNEKKYLENRKELVVCLKNDLFPYEGIEAHKLSGIGGEYLSLIQEKLGLKYKIISTQNEQFTKEFMKKNNCDLKPTKMMRAQKDYVYFKVTSPYLNDYIALVTQKEQPFVRDIKKLESKIFLVNENCYEILIFLEKNYPNLKIKTTHNREEAYKLIAKGKAFGFFSPSLIAFYDIQKKYASSLKILNNLNDTKVGIGVQKEDTILMGILKKVIDSISEERKISIMNKWISTTVESKKDFTYFYYGFIIIFFIYITILFRNHLLRKQNKNLQMRIEAATVDLKKQNRSYLNSLKTFQSLFDTTIESIFLHDNEGKIVMINRSGVKLLGYSNAYELLGKNVYDFIPSYEMQKVKEKLTDRNVNLLRIDLHTKDNLIVPTLVSGRDIIKDGEKLRLNTVVDLTELQQKDKLIQQQSKLALMGEMISMIAHQWRQPLNVIGAINMKIETKLEFEGDMNIETYKPISRNIITQLEFMSKTIDDFRNFFKPNTGKKETSLSEISNKVLSMVSVLIKNKGIQLEVQIETKTKFFSFESELTQVLLNLINNAIDALLENKIKDPRITIEIYEQENQHILKLSDNGDGVPEDIIDTIFEPYFSTKLQKNGTGLGLYMSKVIVEEHCKGSLTVKNNTQGVSFFVHLDK